MHVQCATAHSEHNLDSSVINKFATNNELLSLTPSLNNHGEDVGLLLFYILATSKILSGHIWSCASVNSWWLYSAARLRDQATSTMTWYPHSVTLSWHWANWSLPYPNIMPSTWLGSDKYQFYKSLVWLNQSLNLRGPSPKKGDGCSTHSSIRLEQHSTSFHSFWGFSQTKLNTRCIPSLHHQF